MLKKFLYSCALYIYLYDYHKDSYENIIHIKEKYDRIVYI